jgi:hypothetical protein
MCSSEKNGLRAVNTHLACRFHHAAKAALADTTSNGDKIYEQLKIMQTVKKNTHGAKVTLRDATSRMGGQFA